MISYIDSRANKKVIHASKLKDKKSIKEFREFLIEGMKSLGLALETGLVKEVCTLKELDIDESIPQYVVTEEIIDKISFSQNPEGVIGVCQTLKENAPQIMDKVVYLDNIQDPGNMGTIIRTALALNYDAIILSDNCVSIYNPKVVSATKGAMFLIPILSGNIQDYKKGRTVITSTLNEKSISLDELETPKSFILVLGNEAHGVSNDVIAISDIFVKIPINNIDSLNVAVAGAILMYKLK